MCEGPLLLREACREAALPKGCVPGTTAVAERQVTALLACGGTEYLLGDKVPSDAELFVTTFAPASGALLRSAPLGNRSAVPWDARADFVSADPVVMAASASGDSGSGSGSGSGAYFSFGRNGRPKPPIDFSGPYGEITFSPLSAPFAPVLRPRPVESLGAQSVFAVTPCREIHPHPGLVVPRAHFPYDEVDGRPQAAVPGRGAAPRVRFLCG
ncbi:hypothetical protein ACFCXK_03660 [Streptomyces sp. NPDC056269]|uniref:hypothetical protein n=1 Tax=Streptomyces sp. NPDC056269 TaxID=3345768 RepID=UPI0035DF1B73